MIEDYFNLNKSPFRLGTDVGFYFDSAHHRKALTYLEFGVHQGEGLIVLTGSAGVGKTTLAEKLLSDLEGTDTVAAFISPGPVTQDELLNHILSAFGVEASKEGKVAQFDALREFLTDLLKSGQQAVLIADEAQNFSFDVLEELRQLTNFSNDGQPLLQVFLLGQPRLMSMLEKPHMEQLRQRVLASHQLMPLTKTELGDYIQHRMVVSGWKPEKNLFTEDACKYIFEYTSGIPRKVNTLCSRVLMQAVLNKAHQVDASLVLEVLTDIEDEPVVQVVSTENDDEDACEIDIEIDEAEAIEAIDVVGLDENFAPASEETSEIAEELVAETPAVDTTPKHPPFSIEKMFKDAQTIFDRVNKQRDEERQEKIRIEREKEQKEIEENRALVQAQVAKINSAKPSDQKVKVADGEKLEIILVDDKDDGKRRFDATEQLEVKHHLERVEKSVDECYGDLLTSIPEMKKNLAKIEIYREGRSALIASHLRKFNEALTAQTERA